MEKLNFTYNETITEV